MADEARLSGGLPRAKIAVPRPRVVVRRDRLTTPLGQALSSGRNALIVAPGGTGKSTMVADWAASAPIRVAWYVVDLADRDPRRLLAGICAAVDLALPGQIAEAREAIACGDAEIAVLNRLLGALEDQPIVLVLDDFHHLDGVDEIVSLFEHLSRIRPAHFSLVIISRTIPLLGLAGLTAVDAVIGMGQRELQFNLAESQTLLKAHGLLTGDTTRYVRRSGGWAAGLLLLGRTSEEALRPLREPSERLLERLCAEVIAAFPADLRTFLLESAALGPTSAEAADAILGRHDSRLRFDQVIANGLFLERQGDTYRYHDLFADYLLRVVEREQPEALAAIQKAAAEWWVTQGDVPAALALLAAGRQWAALAEILEREYPWLWARGLWSTILDHLARLPPEFHTPRLLSVGGFAHGIRGENAQALALAERGKALSGGEPSAWLLPAMLAVEALTLSNRYNEALAAIAEALPVATALGRAHSLAHLHEMSGVARFRLGQAAEEEMQRAIALYELSSGKDEVIRCGFQLATLLVEAGQAYTAALHLDEAAKHWKALGNRSLLASLSNTQALLHLLTGDLAAARTAAEQAMEQARAASYPMCEVAAAATLAEVAADADQLTTAESAAQQALTDASRLGLGGSANAARRAQIAVLLARRDRAGARRAIDAARATVITPVDAALLDLAEGQLALRSLANARAAGLLAAAAEQLAILHRPHQAGRALLCLAEAHLRLGHIGKATAALNRIPDLVEEAGCAGYLAPATRFAPVPVAQRRALRHLHRRARLLLDRLAGGPSEASVRQTGAAAQPTLRLSPFGQGAAWLDGTPLDLAALRLKARELLFYGAHAGADLPGDSLLEAVWAGEAGARQALWNAGRDLRRLLGERAWGPHGGRYGLRLPLESDERRFEACAEVALGDGPAAERLTAAERALALLGDGSYLLWCESEWAAAARDRLGSRGLQVALAAAPLAEALGRPDVAVAAARQATSLDPLAEEPRALLIGLLVRLGQHAKAQAEYDAFRTLLREELGEVPSAALRTALRHGA